MKPPPGFQFTQFIFYYIFYRMYYRVDITSLWRYWWEEVAGLGYWRASFEMFVRLGASSFHFRLL